MNTVKIILSIILLGAFTIVQAQTAQVNKVWTEHDVIENGQKGMMIHSSFTISGMQGKQGRCNAWLYYANEEQLLAAPHSENTAPNGSLFVYKSFTPNYSNTNFSDFKLFLPYKELNDILSSETDLLFFIGIDDHNGYSLVDSEYNYFKFTPDKQASAIKPRSVSKEVMQIAHKQKITNIKNEINNSRNNSNNLSYNNSSNKTSVIKTQEGVSRVQLTKSEMELYDLIMEYRRQKGLPNIPISKSLSFVAQTHAKDLQDNFIRGTKCNAHGWSDKGNWKSCCYTADGKQAQCMWDKPRELTPYKGNGFEIAHWHGAVATPQSALNGWKGSSSHNEVIVNQGVWSDSHWNAIGIGINGNYAVVWFGKEEDPVK